MKYGLDVQEDQIKAMPKPTGIFEADYGKEPESIWGKVQNIKEDGSIVETTYAISFPLCVFPTAHSWHCSWPSEDAGAYVELFRDLAAVIRNGQQPKVKWEEAITVLQIVELAHKSSEEGRTFSL